MNNDNNAKKKVAVGNILMFSAILILLLLALFEASRESSYSYSDTGVNSGLAQDVDVEAMNGRLDVNQVWADTARIVSMMTLNRQYSVYFDVLPIIPGDFAIYVQMDDGDDVQNLVHKELAAQIVYSVDMYKANTASITAGPLQIVNLHLVWEIKDDASGDILGRYQLLDQDGDGYWDLSTYDNTRRPVENERFLEKGTIVTRVFAEEDPRFEYGEVVQLPEKWSGTVEDIEEMFLVF